jgi:PAS domain S-box-containing protein
MKVPTPRAARALAAVSGPCAAVPFLRNRNVVRDMLAMTVQAVAQVLSKSRSGRHLIAGLRYGTATLVLAIVYFASAELGFRAAVAHHVVSSAWPPAGIALALLILLGLRWWPSVALGAFLANFVSGILPGAAAAIAVGNTLEAVVGALLLKRLAAFEPRLSRLRDVVSLTVLGAGVSTLVSATIGVASLELAGAAQARAAGTLWTVWWTGDAIGVLLVTPLVLTWWSNPRWRGSTRETAIAALLLMSVVAVASVLFRVPYDYAYAVFPLVLAISWRAGPRGAATATALVAIVAVFETLSGLGPFAVGNPIHNLFLFQTFLGLLAFTALGFAAVTAERQRAAEEVTLHQRHLARAQALAHLGSWQWDVATNRVTWSDELYRIYGLRPEEFAGTFEAFLTRVHPEARERVRAQIARAIADGQPFQIEERIVRPDGTERILESRGEPVRDAGGRTLALVGTCWDVTEWREAAGRLRQSRQELRALAARLNELREQERTALARDVHDQLAQTLTALLFDIGWLARRLPEDDVTLAAKVRQMETLVAATFANVQRIVAELRPAVLDDLGLVAAVEWQTEELRSRTGIEVAIDLPAAELRIEQEDATQVFRVLQEALTNVARHAHATRVEVSLRDAGTDLVLEVRDNGRGISPPDLASGRSVGLIGMRERALERGGEVRITGMAGQGTTVRLSIPLSGSRSTPASA